MEAFVCRFLAEPGTKNDAGRNQVRVPQIGVEGIRENQICKEVWDDMLWILGVSLVNKAACLFVRQCDACPRHLGENVPLIFIRRNN